MRLAKIPWSDRDNAKQSETTRNASFRATVPFWYDFAPVANPMHSPETSPIRLTDMAVGQSGDLTQAIDDATPARLQELGFVEGTTVTLVRTGPLGDPVELELRGYRICLRRSDLAGLEVQLCREGAQ